ncbi:MAG: hypothetical protein Q9M20_04325 [Mariprofundaceae bacterium]|nr:hypothetical protein [Mariprofundaceae bacterium]
MDSQQLESMNLQLRVFIQSAENMQAFADLTSPEDNWEQMDKKITLPKHIGFAVEECPLCFEDIRLIFDKFAGCDLELPLICPYCHEKLQCLSEFTGHTNELYLEEA